MHKVNLTHEHESLVGGVEFSAPNLFSAYRLTWAFIQTEGRRDSTYRIECNGDAMVCKKTISIDAVKGFFRDCLTEGVK